MAVVYFEIPLTPNVPLFTQSITLDSREYLLRFDWSDREKAWYLGISDQDEVPFVKGIKLTSDIALLRRQFWDHRLPVGLLIALSPDGDDKGKNATLENLGTVVKLTFTGVR